MIRKSGNRFSLATNAERVWVGPEAATAHTGIVFSGDAAFATIVNSTLAIINEGPNGRQYLREISAASNPAKGKVTHIVQNRDGDTFTVPVLTPHQAEKAGILTTDEHRSNAEAAKLAEKRTIAGLKVRGRGTKAIVQWDDRRSLQIDPQGRPYGTMRENGPRHVALFHELVHGQHIMAGDWKNGGDPRDPATPSGKEEVRAMRYENGVRQDHNLPLRTQYAEVPPPDEESRAPSVNSGFTSVHTDPSVVWD